MGLEPTTTGITTRGSTLPLARPRYARLSNGGRSSVKIGVDDGTRTHDDRDHNPGLYQLSYAHHGFDVLYLSLAFWRARQDSNLQPPA